MATSTLLKRVVSYSENVHCPSDVAKIPGVKASHAGNVIDTCRRSRKRSHVISGLTDITNIQYRS